VKRIKTDLLVNRTAGLPVSSTVTRAVILGHLKTFAPEILANERFKCSQTFIRAFLHNEMGWSHRTVTRAAQKLPENWEDQCEGSFMRIVYNARVRGICAEAILNGDQTGCSPIPLGTKTWAPQGAKQIDGFGKEEKRQFTLMITTSCSGEMLPVQCIWSGKTAQSLPAARVRAEAEREGHIFTSGGDRHWSTFACMQEVSCIAVNTCQPCNS
jgi:hypothetical protein